MTYSAQFIGYVSVGHNNNVYNKYFLDVYLRFVYILSVVGDKNNYCHTANNNTFLQLLNGNNLTINKILYEYYEYVKE